MATNMECHTEFYGRDDVLPLIEQYIKNRHSEMRYSCTVMLHWSEMPQLASSVSNDHLLIIVTARKGTVSHKNALERLPDEIQNYFADRNIMIIFPDQHGDSMEEMTFAQPQHTEDQSAYESLSKWMKKNLMRK